MNKKKGENKNFSRELLRKNKRGQVAIFVIVAIVIIAFAALAYVYFPKIKLALTSEKKSPNQFITECVKDDLEEYVKQISLQGGTLNPSPYYMYEGNKLQYICYTNENYEACIRQKTNLKEGIEKELEEAIEETVSNCFASLKEEYEKKGYDVSIRSGEIKVKLSPKRIIGSFDYEVVLSKEGSEKYDSFNVILNNNLYELLDLLDKIVDIEINGGDADPVVLMYGYPQFEIERKKQSDGTTVYLLKDREAGGILNFAVRSWVLPPGI